MCARRMEWCIVRRHVGVCLCVSLLNGGDILTKEGIKLNSSITRWPNQ